MRKIGTISSAIGFILLGVWMMINMANPTLGRTLIRWWPILIILVGLEILYYTMIKQGEERLGMSALIIPLILIFFVVNGFSSLSYRFNKNGSLLHFGGFLNHNDWLDGNFENSHWKSVDKQITLDPFGTLLYFEASNGDVQIEKAKDNKITIEAKIYFEAKSLANKYDLTPAKDTNGYALKILDNSVRAVKATIYVPEGYGMSIKGTNMQVKSDDKAKLSQLDIDVNNGNTDLEGDLPNTSIKIRNGKATLQTDSCKNADISVQNGVVTLETKEKNLSVNTDINWGPCAIDDEKRVNSGISKTIGDGTGKVKIKVNTGAIKINSGE